jgi:type 1 glutamine amidotransferase
MSTPRTLTLVTLLLAAATVVATAAPPIPVTPKRGARVLVFSKTAGFRHASIPAGIAAIRELGAQHGFEVDATEDASHFTAERLAKYGAVIFLNTTGDVLDDSQQTDFEAYVKNGGGFVGIHSATDTEYDWPWYGRLVGAYFAGHPRVQPAEIDIVDGAHPSTRHLPSRWQRTDEWYDFRASPSKHVHVLARIDESTYEGGKMGDDHPVAWCHERAGGRAWYTAGGHTKESFKEPAFLSHLLGGLRWVLHEEP